VMASIVAPRPLRTVARAGLLAYLGSLLAVTARAAVKGEAGGAQIGRMPVVLAIMHLSWAAGFFAACARFGPPLRALLRLVRR
jgi:hypothetical protein